MSTPVIMNGEWAQDGQKVLSAWNRSFHFGDGLFETFRSCNGRIPFLEEHFQRASQGARALGMTLPEEWSEGSLKKNTERLMEAWGTGNVRFRLTLFRSGAGAYTPEKDRSEYLLECTGSLYSSFGPGKKDLEVEVHPEVLRFPSPFSAYKVNSALSLVMAKRWAKERGYDEALLLDQHGRIVEGASTNLFLLKGNEIITPPVEDGCVKGVMRGEVMELAKGEGLTLWERSPEPAELLKAEELFLSNSVSGILPVHKFRKKEYAQSTARSLLEALERKVFN